MAEQQNTGPKGLKQAEQMMKTCCAGAIVAAAFAVINAAPSWAESPRPKPRPESVVAAPAEAQQEAAIVTAAAPVATPATSPASGPASAPASAAAPVSTPRQSAKPAEPVRDPNRGAVTNLPLPRYVSLKTNEGNARRGPGLTHRIDWVFTVAGMPLKITAEFENWRRVEDVDGLGGWVHYSLLSGVRTAIVQGDMVDFHTMARDDAALAFRAEGGVVARILTCESHWCRVQVDGQRGWVPDVALWGVDPGESIE